MNKLLARLATTCSAILIAALPAATADATTNNITVFSYAAKFLCEEGEGSSAVDTVVNIHNPSLTQSAQIKLKAVAPQGEEQEQSYYVFLGDGTIEPDLALSFECDQIPSPQPTINTIDPADFEGFLVVLSRKPLDVVAVYEAEQTENGEETEALDVESVKEQKLSVPLSVWNNLGNN